MGGLPCYENETEPALEKAASLWGNRMDRYKGTSTLSPWCALTLWTKLCLKLKITPCLQPKTFFSWLQMGLLSFARIIILPYFVFLFFSFLYCKMHISWTAITLHLYNCMIYFKSGHHSRRQFSKCQGLHSLSAKHPISHAICVSLIFNTVIITIRMLRLFVSS